MKKRLCIFAAILLTISSVFAETTLIDSLKPFASTLVPTNTTANKAKYSFISLVSDDSNVYSEEYVTDCLSEAVFDTGKIRLFERSQMEKILAEQKFQTSGLVNEDTAKEAGRIAGVDFICYGTMKNFKDKIILNVRVVNVETGEICAINHTCVEKDSYLSSIKYKKRSTLKTTASSGTATSYTTSSNMEECNWTCQSIRDNSRKQTVYIFECSATDKEKLRFIYVKNDDNSQSYVKAGIRWATEGNSGYFDIKDEKGNVETINFSEIVVRINSDSYGLASYSGAETYFYNLFMNNTTLAVRKRSTGTFKRFNCTGFNQALEDNGLSASEIDSVIKMNVF